MLLNRPTCTTPATLRMFASVAMGSLMVGPMRASAMQFPLSVRTCALPSIRNSTLQLSMDARTDTVTSQANGVISIGMPKAPKQSTCFRSSATTTMAADCCATIFSRSKAAPPPLINWKCGSNSSVPSITMSNPSKEPSSTNGIPTSVAKFCVATEVGTPTISNPSSLIRRPSSKTVYLTVEPVPRPTRIPVLTNSQAASPAIFFSASALFMFLWNLIRLILIVGRERSCRRKNPF